MAKWTVSSKRAVLLLKISIVTFYAVATAYAVVAFTTQARTPVGTLLGGLMVILAVTCLALFEYADRQEMRGK